jgi:hypothetical protein
MDDAQMIVRNTANIINKRFFIIFAPFGKASQVQGSAFRVQGLKKVLGSEVLGSGFKTADGLKNGQSNRKRNFVVSDKGAFRRSKLILFVLVLGNQNFIEDEGRVRGRRR